MASTPDFSATALLNVAAIGSGNVCTARATIANAADVIGTGSGNRRIESVVLKADGDPADAIVWLWVHNGTASFLLDEIDIGNPVAGSTTVASYRTVWYPDGGRLLLPATHKLQATITVAPTSGSINVFALGGAS